VVFGDPQESYFTFLTRRNPLSTPLSLTELENILYHLNYRSTLAALSIWMGKKAPVSPHQVYEGFEGFLTLENLERIDKIAEGEISHRLRHTFIDHYLQQRVLPYETEMRTWMRGAAAHVEGEKIYIREIIPWCQKKSTRQKRLLLQKETIALSRFLKPFVFQYWDMAIELLTDSLGFRDYVDYCSRKKGIDYEFFYNFLKNLLDQTSSIYTEAMKMWSRKRFGVDMDELTRFDAINILALGEFDTLCPRKEINQLLEFFRYWNVNLTNIPGLHLELDTNKDKSAQAICFVLGIPDEIYVLMRPQGGWVDLETLWHELGHGLSAVHTPPTLPVVLREMATCNRLSEAYAFLLQGVVLSPPFLQEFLGMNPDEAERLYYYKTLKDLSIFRRYSAKFLVEYEAFTSGELLDGTRYSDLMTEYTGFFYHPDAFLLDLVPEFYSLDYVTAWMAEAIFQDYLRGIWGEGWMFSQDAGEKLKSWWSRGNTMDLIPFLREEGLGELTPQPLLYRWHAVLDT